MGVKRTLQIERRRGARGTGCGIHVTSFTVMSGRHARSSQMLSRDEVPLPLLQHQVTNQQKELAWSHITVNAIDNNVSL